MKDTAPLPVDQRGGPIEEPRSPWAVPRTAPQGVPAERQRHAYEGAPSAPQGPEPDQVDTMHNWLDAGTTEPRRRRSNQFVLFSVVILASLVAGYVGGWLSAPSTRDAPVQVPITQHGGGAAVDRAPESVAGIAARVLPSVVAIETAARSGGGGTGSGFVLRSEGYILTNNHVVSDVSRPDEIQVVFNDGSTEPAELVGRSVSYDLAVLKINRSGLPRLEMGDSAEVVVGDPVIAIGAPLGLQSTVTTGIVSAMNRPVSAGQGSSSAFINAIQTDAAINPGNSGGPLVDASGRVVGINSAIAHIPGSTRDSSGSIGLGFSIPSNQAARTATQLINNGEATYPIVGVLLDSDYRGVGVKIRENGAYGQDPITPGSAAEQAGIKPGDVVTKYNGRPLNDPDELIVAIRAQQQGDTVELTVRSGGDERVVKLTLNQSKVDD